MPLSIPRRIYGYIYLNYDRECAGSDILTVKNCIDRNSGEEGAKGKGGALSGAFYFDICSRGLCVREFICHFAIMNFV